MTRPVQNYEQAIEYLYGRINYERAQAGSYSARDFKLDRMRRLLALLGDPHERLPVVHIAGTKGKGSTAAMTASILAMIPCVSPCCCIGLPIGIWCIIVLQQAKPAFHS
jgi:hypothetical protein